ncbi:L-lysine 2,3-aminomutase [Lignipirellula cremea]|uniref:L-lysine 2,3-aminomutase n=2 Tax=Lignipirellula cremea TaxID=2528010 RepID=A0A518DRE9_9BACT|nr:L-lysine 2,3-aminomutase [Lignipirellula cremea]
MQAAIRDPGELLRRLQLPPDLACSTAAKTFPVFAPLEYIARIVPGDRTDPLLLQVLPLPAETQSTEGFSADPLAEQDYTLAPGLLKKYAGRALLVTTGACAIHCRYCFRREFPYQQSGPPAWDESLARIAADSTIEEVLLSGGDPLTLTDPVLARLVQRLAEIPHVRRLRVHTRLPIVIPQRVNAEFLGWLTGSRLTPIVVVHANHPQEIDDPTAAALKRLRQAGVMLLNQTVLLRGVNDQAEPLIELSRRLIDAGTTPYYLHQLDRVRGTAHFETPPEVGQQLIAAMRAALPGYATPRFVQELPGEPNKTVLA